MEEKNTILAGLSYISVILFGILPVLLIYLISKNHYSRLHAKQAFLLAVGAGTLLLLLQGSFFVAVGSSSLTLGASLIAIILVLLVNALFLTFAYMAFKGKDFRFLSEEDTERYWSHWTRSRKST